jgi:hypothetical protein
MEQYYWIQVYINDLSRNVMKHRKLFCWLHYTSTRIQQLHLIVNEKKKETGL